MKRLITVLIGVLLVTGCSWKEDLQTNLFSDIWKDHTTEIMWFRSSSLLEGDAEKAFASWAEGFGKKQSNFIRIEPTKEYTILSEEDALQDENDFFRLVRVVSAESIQENKEEYKHSFFRIIKEGESLVEEKTSILSGGHIQAKNEEDEYEYEKEEKFVVVNSQGVLRKFGTISKKNLKEYKNKHKKDFFVSGELQGKTIIAGINLSRNVGQYRTALESLQKIAALQEEIMGLLFKICVKQKTVVQCY